MQNVPKEEKSVILDAMTELVLYLDTDLKVIWANKAMHDAFNLTPSHLALEMGLYNVHHQPHRQSS